MQMLSHISYWRNCCIVHRHTREIICKVFKPSVIRNRENRTWIFLIHPQGKAYEELQYWLGMHMRQYSLKKMSIIYCHFKWNKLLLESTPFETIGFEAICNQWSVSLLTSRFSSQPMDNNLCMWVFSNACPSSGYSCPVTCPVSCPVSCSNVQACQWLQWLIPTSGEPEHTYKQKRK